MNIRQISEEEEKIRLSPYAKLSSDTKGRQKEEIKCEIRTEFQRDRDRIIHSKAFRRLKHKTQVFIAPEGDHYRTRLTHTLEVSQIARTIARALKLNEDLVEAISLAHDLGHTPFGHTGEKILNELHPNGFKHNLQSIRVVDLLEFHENRPGLNLTFEVREGIINHSGDNLSNTLEGQLVKYADRIAYINHDIDDAIRAEVISEDMLPKDCLSILGETHSKRINTLITDIIENSINQDVITMSEAIRVQMEDLRQFMFENVYFNKKAKKEDDKAEYIVEQVYNYFLTHFDKLPDNTKKIYVDISATKEDIICDYIAGMTDRFMLNTFMDLFVPKAWDRM
ncbi:deoxyguanosinetriphosphate triphosphohydrolase [Soehngenia longivitae]|jgi:dGTPase|uniref:Deoxyguanosinetriphosphate triphosphohydrolase-like protein n=1 Tax=Soehngenia longivitae TaxID=2562294 RepID=A0A4Z0D4V0_9FIRM|nr:deoxyguanosinetriphosphate triphosphohydrolase [Soehngenia longivitae]TFZ40066.1 deoxyguanosinetriphosphate triphosphohydrolase [Soehngenia longivitae]